MFKGKMEVKSENLFQLVLEKNACFRTGKLNVKLEKSWQLSLAQLFSCTSDSLECCAWNIIRNN